MVLYKIVFKRSAEKELSRLPKPYVKKMTYAIQDLAENPRSMGAIKLAGTDAYRIRVGPYRVLYEIHDDVLTVIVIRIADRKEVYG